MVIIMGADSVACSTKCNRDPAAANFVPPLAGAVRVQCKLKSQCHPKCFCASCGPCESTSAKGPDTGRFVRHLGGRTLAHLYRL